MPTYEYQCDGCKKSLEVEQRITEAPLKKCPKCGKPKLRRMVGTGNFILKGSGWYADLYSSPPPSSGAKAGEGAVAADTASAGGSAKTESAPKKEAKPASDAKPAKKKGLSSKGKR